MGNENKKILIIDCDEMLLAATKEFLKSKGYAVDTHEIAFGSTSIINLFQPDLVLIDINMPGLSGDKLDYLIRFAETCRDIPIIFYSASGEDILKCAVTAHKVKGYITKGSFPELKTKVACFLNPA